jgi:hypothetical protein
MHALGQPRGGFAHGIRWHMAWLQKLHSYRAVGYSHSLQCSHCCSSTGEPIGNSGGSSSALGPLSSFSLLSCVPSVDSGVSSSLTVLAVPLGSSWALPWSTLLPGWVLMPWRDLTCCCVVVPIPGPVPASSPPTDSLPTECLKPPPVQRSPPLPLPMLPTPSCGT